MTIDDGNGCGKNGSLRRKLLGIVMVNKKQKPLLNRGFALLVHHRSK